MRIANRHPTMPERGPLSGSRNSRELQRAPRFLLVDDDAALLRSTRRIVGSARPNWQLRTAHTKRDALIELRSRHFDVLVTDIELGGRSGLELLDTANREFPHLACVIHSAQVETYAGHPSLMVADALVRKACQPQELVAALTDALWASVRAVEASGRAAG
jgi:DNA-binding NarL/FixJ family response regulator